LSHSPLLRWLGTTDCRWGYRRGLVTVFHGTQQVLLDSWDDLFELGAIEEVQVNNLWHLGTVLSLRQCLDRPSLRALRLRAQELRDDDVYQLRRVADWLVRLDEVELFASSPTPSAVQSLQEWLASSEALGMIRWQKRLKLSRDQ
jgi:hypothetical protein